MQAETSVLNCHVARQYPTPDPDSPIRCECCGLNAFDVAFIVAQTKLREMFCCGAAVVSKRIGE